MKNTFLTTIYGPDSPGIIRALAQATRGIGGEWLTSKVIKLEGQFTAIMSVVVARDLEDKLKSELERLFADLSFVYAPARLGVGEPSKTIILEVECIDRPGLTGDISNILANLDIGVENMEFKRYPVPGIGHDTVFSAKLSLAVPEVAESEVIAGEIEALSEDVRVSVM